MMPDPSSGDDAQGASDDGRSLFCDMQRAPRGSTCGLPFAYAACRAACGCDFACVFVCGMPCACTPVRSPVCDTPRCGRAAAKRLVPRSASCPLPDAARCGGDTAAEACAATLRVSSFAACRALALVFAARFAMPRARVRSPVCDAPRCGRAAAKRLVPRSASCSLPGCCSVRRGCGRRGGIRRLRSAPRNSIRASRRRGCRPRKRRRGRRRRAVQRS